MSTPLADAFVRVRPDTKGFAQETEAQTAGLSGAFNKLGDVIAGVFAATTIIEWGKKSVEAFLDAEKSQNALHDAFARFPALADTNIKSLEGLDAALGKKTEFDKYSIESGQAVLAQFHLTGTQLTTLTPLLLDYAAKTGKDLPAASEVLGKALLGQGRGLKDVGIAFTNTGTATGNYNELVGALRTQVGGFAQDEGRSAAGQLKIMENQFKDLGVEIGSVIVPVMSTLVGVVLDITGVLQGTIGWLEKNQAAAIGLAAALGTLLLPAMLSLVKDAVEFIATNVRDSFIAAADGVKAFAEAATFADLAIAPLAIAIGAIGYLVVKSGEASKKAWDEGKQAADAYSDSLIRNVDSVDTMQQSLNKLGDRLLEQATATKAAFASGDDMNKSFFKQISTLGELDAKYKEQQAAVAQMADNQSRLAHQYGLTTAQVETLAAVNNIDLSKSYDGVAQAFKAALAVTTASHHPLTLAQQDFKKVSDRASSATDQVNALRDAFDLLVGKSLSADEASITFANDLADLNAKLKAAKGSMDLTTQSGRDAREQFDKTAQAALDLATSQKDAGFSTRTIKADLDKSIASLEKAAGSNAHARAEVAKLKAAEDGLNTSVKNVNTSLSQVPNNPYAGVHIPGTGGVAGGGKFSAFGGLVTGPGTKTSDSVRMNLSAGEFVLDADTTERLGLPTLNALLSGGSLPASAPTVTALPVGGSDDKAAALLAEQNALLRQQNALLAQQPAALAGALNGVAQSSAHQSRGTVPVY